MIDRAMIMIARLHGRTACLSLRLFLSHLEHELLRALINPHIRGCLDFRPVASACATALDQRHPVYMLTVEGYARRGNERSDGMRVELRAEAQGGEEKIYDPPFPRSYVSRSFVSRACARVHAMYF
jgi:hypothetical protein